MACRFWASGPPSPRLTTYQASSGRTRSLALGSPDGWGGGWLQVVDTATQGAASCSGQPTRVGQGLNVEREPIHRISVKVLAAPKRFLGSLKIRVVAARIDHWFDKGFLMREKMQVCAPFLWTKPCPCHPVTSSFLRRSVHLSVGESIGRPRCLFYLLVF